AAPAVAFALWPILWRREGGPTFLPLPPDAREQLQERKRAALRALRELDFEHGAGHLSDADHAELRARYESEAGAVLTELDRLGAREAVRGALQRGDRRLPGGAQARQGQRRRAHAPGIDRGHRRSRRRRAEDLRQSARARSELRPRAALPRPGTAGGQE